MLFKAEMSYFTKMLEFSCVLMSTHSKLVLYSLKHLLAFFPPFLVAENQDFFPILKNTSKIIQKRRILKFTVSLFSVLRMFNFPFSLFTLMNLFEFAWFYSPIFKASLWKKILLISLFFSCRILSLLNLQKIWKNVKFATGHWGCSVINFRKSRALLGR